MEISPTSPPDPALSLVEWERQVMAVIQLMRRSLNLNQTLNTAIAEISPLFQGDRVLVVHYQPGWNGTVVAEFVSPPWQAILNNTIQDSCFTNHTYFLKDSQTQSIPDIHSAALDSQYVDFLTKYQVKAILSAPIWREQQLWGSLTLHQCKSQRQWQPWESTALQELAAHLGTATLHCEQLQQLQQANAELERQVQKSNAQLKLATEFEATLKRVTDRVRDSIDENQILQTAVRELAITAGVSNCNASVYDISSRTSTVRYEHTTSLATVQGRIVVMDNFPEGYNQLLQGQYFQFCSLQPNPKRGRVAMLACPIVDDQEVLGDLWLISQAYRAFNEQDIRLVEQVANQCAIAIRQARLYQAAQAQVEELEKLNRLKDDFLSTVSHELRTPMSNIKMATHMLEITLRRSQLLDDPNASLITRYFRILNDECQRETRLINDLLDLARLETANEPLILTAIDLTAWLPHLVAPFMERARSHQQGLELQVAPDIPHLFTDVSRLERVLNELLNNACKYTPAQETIQLVVSANQTNIVIGISNSGVEISPNDLTRIFDKFYRIPDKDPWKHGGTGLGLALVKRLVETLGGCINATSTQQRTNFVLELPRTAVEPLVD